MHKTLYQSISAACCHISVTLGSELISEGSGFAFLSSGQVITAAHVITGRMPIRESDYRDPLQKIFCKFPGRPQQEYVVNTCGMTITIPGFTEQLQIDIATLQPKHEPQVAVPHLVANTNPPQLGELVFAAGYSDELEPPFQLDRLIPGGKDTLNGVANSNHGGYLADMGGPMIKRGVVGNIVRSETMYGNGQLLQVDVFYVDNSVHSGASGGPICNVHGDAVGVITQRSVTSASQEVAPKIFVPSGCTIGIGLQPLRAWS